MQEKLINLTESWRHGCLPKSQLTITNIPEAKTGQNNRKKKVSAPKCFWWIFFQRWKFWLKLQDQLHLLLFYEEKICDRTINTAFSQWLLLRNLCSKSKKYVETWNKKVYGSLSFIFFFLDLSLDCLSFRKSFINGSSQASKTTLLFDPWCRLFLSLRKRAHKVVIFFREFGGMCCIFSHDYFSCSSWHIWIKLTTRGKKLFFWATATQPLHVLFGKCILHYSSANIKPKWYHKKYPPIKTWFFKFRIRKVVKIF